MPLQGGLQRSWGLYVEQALQATLLLKKDIDYVVADGKIVLVDGATGVFAPIGIGAKDCTKFWRSRRI